MRGIQRIVLMAGILAGLCGCNTLAGADRALSKVVNGVLSAPTKAVNAVDKSLSKSRHTHRSTSHRTSAVPTYRRNYNTR